MSPSKLGGNGDENNAHVSEVTPTQWFYIPSIPKSNNPTKLLIINLHDIFLDTSLLTQPNSNPNILVTKKTLARWFVFTPWMMEFWGRCFKIFAVAFWGTKSSEYMEDVLHEILLVFENLEGHMPIF